MPVAAPIAAGAATAVVGSMLNKNKGGGTTTTVQNTDPWSGVKPYLYDLYSRGQGALNSGYSGPKLAPGATEQIGRTISGEYLNPSSNPFLQNYVNDALGLVKSNFAGQYGGDAGGNLGNSGYQEMLTRTLANTALPIYANVYNTERQNQLQAAQLGQSVDTANMQAPFVPLREYSALLQNSSGGTTASQQPYFTNPAAGALGMGLAGAQIYGALNQPSQAPLIQGMIPGQYSLGNPAYG